MPALHVTQTTLQRRQRTDQQRRLWLITRRFNAQATVGALLDFALSSCAV